MIYGALMMYSEIQQSTITKYRIDFRDLNFAHALNELRHKFRPLTADMFLSFPAFGLHSQQNLSSHLWSQ